jgi:hypothetical protein
MKFIADQLAGAGANQNIDRIRPRQRFQARREIYRVADHGRVGFFLRTDVASEDIVMIDANADPERRDPFRFPFRVGGLKFVPHGERGPRTGFGVFRNASAPHVPQTAMTASPINLSSVPSFSKTAAVMRLKYSLSCLTSASGSALSVGVVKPTMSEKGRQLLFRPAIP